jgi:hypothetical protein
MTMQTRGSLVGMIRECRQQAGRLKTWWIAGILLMIGATLVCRGQVTTTAVQDTVYHADGTLATGTILVSWPAFATVTGNTVAAGNLNVTIGSNGQVTMNLAPNVGATPAGTYYTAVYHLNDGTVSKEYWNIPNVSSTSVAAIRSLIMPASIAVQTITATQVSSMLNKYLPLNGGVLSGALVLPGDPQSASQAATKNYVDNAVAPISTAIGNVVSAAPKANQIVQQPAGTTLTANVFAGSYFASNFRSGSQDNGISNLVAGSNCATSAPGGHSGCTIEVDPTYDNTENPQGYGTYLFGNNISNMNWPLDTHVHDERNGVTADYYENPFSVVPYQSAGQMITSAISLDFQKWPSYGGNAAGSEYLQTTDYAGGMNFDNYFGYGQPEYFFKPYYDNLSLATTNYTSGQQEAIENVVNCHGTGDCLAMTTLLTCDGGVNSANDEGCHGGDFNITEDTVVYRGVVTSAVPVGSTVVPGYGTAGQGTEGQDRLLLDTNPARILTGTSVTGYAGSVTTGPSGNSAVVPDMAIDSNANFPVSTMVQLCYPGSDNGVGGAAGCAAGSQPLGFIPSAPNLINPATSVTTDVVAAYTATAPQTGLPAGFCTPSTLQATNSSGACYLPPTGVACITDQEEYETVDYNYNSSAQQITLLNLRFPHNNGLFFAHGGLCGYAAEQQSEVFSGDGNNNGISQIFPVEGSPNSTSFYYVSQRTNLGYTLPVLGVSTGQNGVDQDGGGECFALNTSIYQLQPDNRTVLVASSVPFNTGDLSPINGMTLTITTPNSTYNGSYVVSYGTANSGGNIFYYTLPAAPTGAAPTSGTASFCNTNYKLYPGVRVNSVLDTATNKVDGTMNTMPSPVAFAAGDTVMQPHYPWIYTGHDGGRGIGQFLPRMYNGGSLYGMTYNYLLSGRPFIGFAITNATDQNRYLGYGGTHEQPGAGYYLGGDWDDNYSSYFPGEDSVINVTSCKPGPIGCNNFEQSNFNVLKMPSSNAHHAQALNYDPNTETWTFGTDFYPHNNPQFSALGTVQANIFHALTSVTAPQIGVGGTYLFNTGGSVALTNTPATPEFNSWFANYAYGFGAQNSKVIDGFLYRGGTANTVDCGTGTGDTSCTFTAGVVNAGTSVSTPAVAASASITTPSLTVGGGSAVSHVSYDSTGSITPTAVAAEACSDQTFTVSGLVIADDLGSIHPPSALGNLSLLGYANAANTLTLHFCNVSAASVTPPAGAYGFLAMH